MTGSDKDDILLKQVKQHLNESVEQLDAATLSQLNQARQQALQLRRVTWSWPKPVMALGATAAMLTLTVSLLWTPTMQNSLAMEDLPMLTASEDMELYQELEFYQWLTDEAQNG